MNAKLSDKHFHDEAAAYAWVEARVWPDGPVCPHCGESARVGRLTGKSTRIGVHKCYRCRRPFTVKVKTIFESSHVPLRLWLQAMFLMASSKKGFSANQLHRVLGVTLKTAWFMAHRIREAMRSGDLAPMGGAGQIVEIDETIIGFQEGMSKKKSKSLPKKVRSSSAYRNVVMTLVSREGSARSFHVSGTTIGTLIPIIRTNIRRETSIMTDEASWYAALGNDFAKHETVNHQTKEYARGEVSTNTVEGYYSIFKRGMKGVYQHCAEKHLHRYLAEFDFRYSNRVALGIDDAARAEIALKGIVGKRLTYRATGH